MKGLIERIGETVKGRLVSAKLTSKEDKIRKFILREFAKKGVSPSPKKIGEGLGIASEDIVNKAIEKLEKNDILLKRGKKIISAYPFSALETRYRVIFEDGRKVYALCATDAMGIHFMLKEDIAILSRCPECEGELKIVVKDGRIDSTHPEGIVEFVGNKKRSGCTAETICPFINFFCSKERLNIWREKNPEYAEGEVYSLSEALQHGKAIFGDFLK